MDLSRTALHRQLQIAFNISLPSLDDKVLFEFCKVVHDGLACGVSIIAKTLKAYILALPQRLLEASCKACKSCASQPKQVTHESHTDLIGSLSTSMNKASVLHIDIANIPEGKIQKKVLFGTDAEGLVAVAIEEPLGFYYAGPLADKTAVREWMVELAKDNPLIKKMFSDQASELIARAKDAGLQSTFGATGIKNTTD